MNGFADDIHGFDFCGTNDGQLWLAARKAAFPVTQRRFEQLLLDAVAAELLDPGEQPADLILPRADGQ